MRLLQNLRRLARATRRVLKPAPPRKPRHLWSIAIYTGSAPWELHPGQDSGNPILTRDDIVDVPTHFVADPFMMQAGGRWHLFFEIMNAQRGKGEIGLALSDDAVHWRYDSVVLREPFHLSYPHVFEWAGDRYMIPETSAAGVVRLYRARRFPYEWDVAGTLLTGHPFADASVFRAGDHWWMFVETAGLPRFDVLRLYHATELDGPWQEHRHSPIASGDARIARPGGRVVTHEGRMVRFAQETYPTYGTAVRAFEITRLGLDSYTERPMGAEPVLRGTGAGWNADGMHHVDAHPLPDGGWIACVDGWRVIPAYLPIDPKAFPAATPSAAGT